MKTCTNCSKKKPLTAFGKHKSKKDGLRYVCRECNNAAKRGYYAANRETFKTTNKRWVAENRSRVRKHNSTWERKNRPKMNAKLARRRAGQLRATPAWLTSIQLAQIQEFYEIADARTVQIGVVHHVDHIHPLQGENFRGLHVPWNLQVLTAFDNVSKGNRLLQPSGE